jgi:sulfate permease, SulP family
MPFEVRNIFKDYNFSLFIKDLLAGIIVGVVALPLAISFGFASGISPVIGVFTTIFASVIIGLLGGSTVQIAGPTAASIVLIFNINRLYGPTGLATATFMAGIILIIAGFLRFGRAIKSTPDSLIQGLTAGISLDLIMSQIKYFFGLNMGKVPTDIIEKSKAYIDHIGSINWNAFAIGAATIAIIEITPLLITKKIPGALIALTLTSLAASYFHLPVATIGNNFGEFIVELPPFTWPRMEINSIRHLIRPAMSIAVLVSFLSLIAGVVAEKTVRRTFRSNKELVAEGIANMFTAVCGGIPVSGSLSRTKTNYENGATTPVAGIVQGIILLVVLYISNKWIGYIPVAAIAGLLISIAYKMERLQNFWEVIKSRSTDTFLLIITFATYIFADMTAAIEVGLVYAAFQFIMRMSRGSDVSELTAEENNNGGMYILENLTKVDIPEGVSVYEVSGTLFFGSAYKFKESIARMKVKPTLVIIRMRLVSHIDLTGIRIITHVNRELKKQHIKLLISEYYYKAEDELLMQILTENIGKDYIHRSFIDAVAQAKQLHEATLHQEQEMPAF